MSLVLDAIGLSTMALPLTEDAHLREGEAGIFLLSRFVVPAPSEEKPESPAQGCSQHPDPHRPEMAEPLRMGDAGGASPARRHSEEQAPPHPPHPQPHKSGGLRYWPVSLPQHPTSTARSIWSSSAVDQELGESLSRFLLGPGWLRKRLNRRKRSSQRRQE